MEQPNLDYINNLAGNDEAFRQKLISTIKRELPLEITEFNDKIDSLNFLRASENVHKLKHKISVFGMEKSYYLAETFEEHLKNKNTDLHEDFQKVLKSMQDFADSL